MRLGRSEYRDMQTLEAWMLIFLREIRILSGTRLWRHSCDILVKHLAIFRLYSEILGEAELKSNGLVCLVEEVLR